jgi:hypothetical protein
MSIRATRPACLQILIGKDALGNTEAQRGPDGGSGKTASGRTPVKSNRDKLPNHQDRTASMPHNPSCIRSQKKTFKFGAMGGHDNKISAQFLSYL